MTRGRVQPFPWHALASTSRAEARAARGMRLAAENMVRVADVARAVGELVQARVEAFVRHVKAGSAAAGDGVGVLFARADDPLAMCLVEVEPALAAALCARALRRRAPVIVDPARGASEDVAGALGAILVAAGRRVHAGAALSVRGAGSARALASSLGTEVAVASLTVLVDDDAYLARAAVPRAHALRAERADWGPAVLAALADTPLAMSVVAAATLATAADVAALAPGDAWMPGAWPLGAPPKLAGPVALASAGSDEGLRATLGEDGRLVLDGDRVTFTMTSEERNVNEAVNEAVGQALGDVPVVVRVEVGAAEMRAREWAALGKGDVVALGTRIAEPVVLRVGGVEVARGELVEIEGEVGVRILSKVRA